MIKETYYKRVVNGKTLEIHLFIEDQEKNITTSIIYPETETDKHYDFKEFVELNDLDQWLDEGLASGIFTCSSLQ